MADWPRGSRPLACDAPVARLATVDESGAPHAVPICFVVLEDRLYSVVDAKPKKNPLRLRRLRNISSNPRVAVIIDRYDGDWSQLAWAMLRGRARIVEDDGDYATALEALKAKYEQYRTMTFRRAANPMICIEIERVTAWRASVLDSSE